MGGQPFFLGMGDTPEYRADTAAMRKVIRPDDIPDASRPAVEDAAERIVADAGGRLEVVDDLVRRVTFDVLGDYFGVPDPPDGDLRVWATRLFEFQFADRATTPRCGPRWTRSPRPCASISRPRSMQRRASGVAQDDVLGRCLDMQAEGRARVSRRPDPHRPDGLHRRRAAAAADGRAAGARAVAAPPRGARRGAGGGAQRRRRAARRLRLRGDALRSARPGAAARRAARTARSPRARDARSEGRKGRNRARRLQLRHDGRAARAGAAQHSTRAGCRTNTSISATACTPASAST